jgi:hypothetical protein
MAALPGSSAKASAIPPAHRLRQRRHVQQQLCRPHEPVDDHAIDIVQQVTRGTRQQPVIVAEQAFRRRRQCLKDAGGTAIAANDIADCGQAGLPGGNRFAGGAGSHGVIRSGRAR